MANKCKNILGVQQVLNYFTCQMEVKNFLVWNGCKNF